MPTASSRGWQSLLRRPAVLLVLALLALASVVSLVGRLTRPAEAVVRPLSQDAGADLFPAWSPDGRNVAYSSRTGDRDVFHIVVRPVRGGSPRSLTGGTANDVGPAWSPDGNWLAFARLAEGRTQYIVVPAQGGKERTVVEFNSPVDRPDFSAAGSMVAWTPDGKSLLLEEPMKVPSEKPAGRRSANPPSAIVVIPAGGGESRPITAPPEGTEGDTMPAVSPDGRSLAFVRRTGPETGDIWASDVSGQNPRRVTFDEHQVHGFAWTADGTDIVFASNRASGWRLWRVTAAGGSPREIRPAGRRAQFPAIARVGDLLVYCQNPGGSSIWRSEVNEPAAQRSLIRSAGRDSSPSYSPDGRRIAFVSDRRGEDQIWVAEADGTNPVPVTNTKGLRLLRPRWSPDSRRLAFGTQTLGQNGIYAVAAAGGQASLVTRTGSNPSWARSGKWIYFDWRMQLWKVAPDGSGRQQLGQHRGSNPIESPDGKWIYYFRGREMWRVAVSGGEEERLYEPERGFPWGTPVAAANGLYFTEWDFRSRTMSIAFYDSLTRKAHAVLPLDRTEFDRTSSFDISPDGKFILYPRTDQSETNLMLLEGFR
jgi:Tol biopolymer transport system component